MDKVNLVINLDVPYDGETYLHRVGRTGRFGTLGIAISCVTAGEREFLQRSVSDAYLTPVNQLPENLEEIIKENYHFELTEEQDKLAAEQLDMDSLKLKDYIKRREEKKSKKLEAKKQYEDKKKIQTNIEEKDDIKESAAHYQNYYNSSPFYYGYNAYNYSEYDNRYNPYYYTHYYYQQPNYTPSQTAQRVEHEEVHRPSDHEQNEYEREDDVDSVEETVARNFDWHQYYAGLRQFYQVYSQLWMQFTNQSYPNPWDYNAAMGSVNYSGNYEPQSVNSSSQRRVRK